MKKSQIAQKINENKKKREEDKSFKRYEEVNPKVEKDPGYEKNDNEFIIYPAKLGRRILSFLGDFFITFILCIFFYECACMPIGRASVDYVSKSNDIDTLNNERIDLLYENKIILENPSISIGEEENNRYNFENAQNYTSDQFIYFYTYKEEESLNFEDYEVCYIYQLNTKKVSSASQYSNILKGNNPNTPFKDELDSNGFLILKDEYKEYFKPYFTEGDSMSNKGSKAFENFKYDYFNSNFSNMIEEFSLNNDEFIYLTNQIEDINNSFSLFYQTSAVVSLITSCIIMYLVIPLIDKKGRTLLKIILKLEYIDIKKFNNIKKHTVIWLFFLNLLENLAMVMFIPFISFGISNVFSLEVLLIFTIISICYDLICLFVAACNSYNKSFKELFFNLIVVDEKTMDELMVARMNSLDVIKSADSDIYNDEIYKKEEVYVDNSSINNDKLTAFLDNNEKSNN